MKPPAWEDNFESITRHYLMKPWNTGPYGGCKVDKTGP